MFGGKYGYGFWRMIISLSMRFSGILSMYERGPNPSRVSFRFWVSVLLMAPVSGAATV
jgi:hypothetical protein